MPFLLVFFRAASLPLKGYIGYAMTFVSGAPAACAGGEGTQLLAVAACTAAALILVPGGIWMVAGPDGKKRDSVGESLDRLAALLKRMAEEGRTTGSARSCMGWNRASTAWDTATTVSPGSSDPQKLFYNMFAILFQRAV